MSCQSLPGSCLATRASLLVHLCTWQLSYGGRISFRGRSGRGAPRGMRRKGSKERASGRSCGRFHFGIPPTYLPLSLAALSRNLSAFLLGVVWGAKWRYGRFLSPPVPSTLPHLVVMISKQTCLSGEREVRDAFSRGRTRPAFHSTVVFAWNCRRDKL